MRHYLLPLVCAALVGCAGYVTDNDDAAHGGDGTDDAVATVVFSTNIVTVSKEGGLDPADDVNGGTTEAAVDNTAQNGIAGDAKRGTFEGEPRSTGVYSHAEGVYSRATLTDEALTDLYVFDYMDGEYVGMVHQVSNEEGFGQPKISGMKYGSHDLVFVAHKAQGFSYNTADKTVWFESSIKPTWMERMSLTVGKDTQNQSVNLTQRTWRLTYNILDALPTGAKEIAITVGNKYGGMTWAGTGLVGAKAVSTATTVDVSGYVGRSGLTVSTYGFAPSMDEYTASATITVKNTAGTVLATYTKDIPLQADYQTTVKGNFFAADKGMTVTVSGAFKGTEKEVDL